MPRDGISFFGVFDGHGGSEAEDNSVCQAREWQKLIDLHRLSEPNGYTFHFWADHKRSFGLVKRSLGFFVLFKLASRWQCKVAAFCKQYMPDEISRSWTIDWTHSDFTWFIRCISGAFAKMVCPTCDQAVKRAVGKRSQANWIMEVYWNHHEPLEIGHHHLWEFLILWLGERLSGDCLGEVLTASFHAMDEMLRSPDYERPLLALKQASWEVRKCS